MRIRYINPVGSGVLDRYFDEQLAGAAGPDVDVETCHLDLARVESPFLPDSASYQGALMEKLAESEAAGYDAAVIGCSGDPGLLDARRLVKFPVSAPLDAALHLAAQLHQRLAILVADGFEAHILYQDLARYYGLGHHIAEILTVPMEYGDTSMDDDPEGSTWGVIGRHRDVLGGAALELAQGAVSRGAGVVYAGCTFWTGEMLEPFRAAVGVPVVDPGRGAVALAAAAVRAAVGTAAPVAA